ncbi:MFS transporter [Alicyclobacillus sp. ALC3]|uniref:MFS transporter n=1 Tax=Alicyclobacillus sp. ALC3 TaxID=2796143 RepID=UPI0023798E02|nr:MFS transporter [Alicyclobacillus sp. ALC3]WDL95696.1 MFS transporter [Alicyclobacillus sp. ALC3]
MVDRREELALSRIRLQHGLTPQVTMLLGIALLSAATFYMVQPFFVIYFREALGFSVSQSGLLVALPFLPAILFGLLGGYISDRIGVLRSYTLGLLIYGLSVGAISFLNQFIYILILMIVSGFAVSVMSGGIQSVITLVSVSEHRARLQNYLYWINNVGALLGLLVASELLRAGHSNVPIILLGVTRVAMFLLFASLFWKRISSEKMRHEARPSARSLMVPVFKAALSDKALLLTTLSVFLLTVMESQLDSTIPLYFTEHFSNGVVLFGPIVAITTVMVVIGQPIALRLFSYKDATIVFSIGALCTGGGLALGGMVGSVWSWVVGMVLYSIGEALWAIKLNDQLSSLPTEGNTALYFATFATAQNLSFFIGISLGSLVYHSVQASVLFGSMIVIAVIVSVSFALAFKIHQESTVSMNAVKNDYGS